MSPAQDKPSDRSAAKAGAGSTPKGGKPAGKAGAKPAAAPRRMSREASLALVLLPVLLVAGFLLGGQLLSTDDEPATLDAASTPTVPAETESEPAGEDDELAGPALPEGPAPEDAPPAEEPPAEEPAEAPAEAPAAPEAPAEEPAPAPEAPAPAPEAPAPAPEAPAPAPAPEAPAPAPAPEAPAEPAPAPAQAGTSEPPVQTAGVGTIYGPGSVHDDVRVWQQRMADRGWDIQVDGIYGSQTAKIAAKFQAEKGLAVDGLVGPSTWNAAWTAPIT